MEIFFKKYITLKVKMYPSHMDLSTGVSNMSNGSFQLSSHLKNFLLAQNISRVFSEILIFLAREPFC